MPLKLNPFIFGTGSRNKSVLGSYGSDAQAGYGVKNIGGKGRGKVLEAEDVYVDPTVRLRRASDDAEKSFSWLDVFLGVARDWVNEGGNSNGFVTKLYDQTAGITTSYCYEDQAGNGGFEDGLTGWTGTGGVSVETTEVDSGTKSAKIAVTGGGYQEIRNDAAFGDFIAGDVFRVMARVKVSDGTSQFRMDVGDANLNVKTPIDGGWNWYEVTEAAAITTNATIRITRSTASGDYNIYVDQVIIQKLDHAPNDAVQATAANQPKLVDAGVYTTDDKGNIAPDFDGTTHRLGTTFPLTGTQHIFAIADGTNAVTNSAVLGNRDSADERAYILKGATYPQWACATEFTEETTAPTFNTTLMMGFMFNGSTKTFHVNGTEYEDSAQAATVDNVTHNMAIGAWNNAGTVANFFKGPIAAVLVYDADKSTEREEIEWLLAQRFGISGPAYPFQPAAVGGLPVQDSSMILWLDGSDTSTMFDATSGGSTPANLADVLRWEDKSASANHARASVYNPLSRKDNHQNGLTVLRSDAGECLTLDSNTGNVVRTAFVVREIDNATANRYVPLLGTASNNPWLGDFNYYVFDTPPNSEEAPAYGDHWLDSNSVDFKSTLNSTNLAVYTVRCRTGDTPDGEDVDQIIQDRADTTRSWVGEIAEIILYDVRLTDQQITDTIDYLKTKWGIA